MAEQTNRVSREAEIYDQQLLRRETYDAMLDHANHGPARRRRDTFVRDIMQHGAGKQVLEIGSQAWAGFLCRHGIQPAHLTCINISSTEIEHGRKQADAYRFDVDFQLMDAHDLKLPAESQDIVFGVAILHHLDFERAIREIHRVTKPGGEILFVEPLLLNPIAQVVRWLTPAARTPDERPLGLNELRFIDRFFRTQSLFTELFHVPGAMLSRFMFKDAENPVTRATDAVDRGILRVCPWAGPIYRTVTIYGRKI